MFTTFFDGRVRHMLGFPTVTKNWCRHFLTSSSNVLCYLSRLRIFSLKQYCIIAPLK